MKTQTQIVCRTKKILKVEGKSFTDLHLLRNVVQRCQRHLVSISLYSFQTLLAAGTHFTEEITRKLLPSLFMETPRLKLTKQNNTSQEYKKTLSCYQRYMT